MAETVLRHTLSASSAAVPADTGSTWWLAPSPLVLFVSILIAISIPLFLHLVIYRSSANSTLPTFVLVGPSGAGKTALQSLIERVPSPAALTCTSQTPKTVEASVPVAFSVASNRYRSVNDPSAATHKRFLLTDTPGHGKLRYHALNLIRKPASAHVRGIIFVTDATALAPESAELRDVAEYLHDVLLDLQTTRNASSKDFPVLLVVNKLDLFTALPEDLAAKALEAEIGKIRVTRQKGIMDAGTKEGELGAEREWLGQGGEGDFDFRQMEDAGVVVTLMGSKAAGEGETDIAKLWEWIGEQL